MLHYEVNTEWITFILSEGNKEQKEVSEKQSSVLVTLSVRAAIFNGSEELMEQDCPIVLENSQLTSFYPARTFQISCISSQVYNIIQLKKTNISNSWFILARVMLSELVEI